MKKTNTTSKLGQVKLYDTVNEFDMLLAKNEISLKAYQLETKSKVKNDDLENDDFLYDVYTSQLYDLYNKKSIDDDRYAIELLHFDLFIKNESINAGLKKERIKNYYGKIYNFFNDDIVKNTVYNKTEKNIINKTTCKMIINEIKNNIKDRKKLDFIIEYIEKKESVKQGIKKAIKNGNIKSKQAKKQYENFENEYINTKQAFYDSKQALVKKYKYMYK